MLKLNFSEIFELEKIPLFKEFEWFEWFEWFGPSPIEPFNSAGHDIRLTLILHPKKLVHQNPCCEEDKDRDELVGHRFHRR